ncbi:MAG: hypothetical protein ACNS62_21155 [Candidatus Cyclobacteriaceae bacterium M3_2C_046]
MELVEVTNQKYRKAFLQLPVKLYKDSKYWIRPLDQDIEGVFDPQKNKYLKEGSSIRWILLDHQQQVIGRVAAFVNKKTAYTFDQPTGGIGFFECINDQAAANKLFEQSREWLQQQGMEAMDGPVNFGDRDRWWGLLVDGFNIEPNYCTPYNFPYYQQLFENYGFQLYFRQYTYARMVHEDGLAPQIKQKAALIRADPDYTFRHIEKKRLELYAEDFRFIFNKAWRKHLGVKEMTREQAVSIMKKLKPVLDERIIWFGYYKKEPIAFYINLPELNQIFKFVHGKLNWWGKLIFLYHKYRNTCDKMFGVSFGVIPEFQGKGIEGAIVDAFSEFAWSDKHPYKTYEMNWIGDFNPKMMHVCENVGGRIIKTHITYRKLFDETKAFERAPIIS